MDIVTFWFVLTVACIVWYSTITVYVSVRAMGDIRNMLARIRAASERQDDQADDSPNS